MKIYFTTESKTIRHYELETNDEEINEEKIFWMSEGEFYALTQDAEVDVTELDEEITRGSFRKERHGWFT